MHHLKTYSVINFHHLEKLGNRKAADRQTDRQTDTQTDTQTDRQSAQIGRKAYPVVLAGILRDEMCDHHKELSVRLQKAKCLSVHVEALSLEGLVVL